MKMVPLYRILFLFFFWFVFAETFLVNAEILGKSPSSFKTHKVFGDAEIVGNTLMTAVFPGGYNGVLLPQSSATVRGVPFDGQLVEAYVWWTGSVDQAVDRSAELTLPNGTKVTLQADTCETIAVRIIGSYYYCRKDVSALLQQNAKGVLNGNYTVGGVDAKVGVSLNDNFSQAMFAAWSMVLVWKSPTAKIRKDIVIYDGFLWMDEIGNPNSPRAPVSSGITSFNLSGFKVGDPAEGSFTFFGLEGDRDLGSPPDPVEASDFISIQSNSSTTSTRLQSSTPNNPPGNLWNSTISVGVDLDSFNIGKSGLNLINSGDSSLTITCGTGDGIVPSLIPGSGNDGEAVVMGFVVLTVDTLSPNFRNENTFKRVDKLNSAVGDTLTYTLRVRNTGSLEAKNVIVKDTIPSGTTYVLNSTKLDGQAVPDVGGTSPVVQGFNLGTIDFRTKNEREITFQVKIVSSPANKKIENFFTIKSDEVEESKSNVVETTLQSPQLGTFEKTMQNQTLPGKVVRPGDTIVYTITGQNKTNFTLSGIQLIDDLPKYVQFVSVFAPAGSQNSSSATGGVNGTGRIDIKNISIPAGFSAQVFITVRVFTEAEFINAGVSANQIHGLLVSNQGELTSTLVTGTKKTDDPATPAVDDPTVFSISYKANFTTSTKKATDENSGRLEPGDTIRYTVTLSNTGTRDTVAIWKDSLPLGVENYKLVSSPSGSQASFQAAPAGSLQNGEVTIQNIALKQGSSTTIVFTVTVKNDASNGLGITNIGEIEDGNDQSKISITSETLTVVSGPLFAGSTKGVSRVGGGSVFSPGDTVTYTLRITNSGNKPATDVVISDVLPNTLENIQVTPTSVLSGNALTWDKNNTPALASVAVGASVTVTYTAKIKSNVADGTLISNQAKITTPGLPNTSTLTDDPSTPRSGDATVIRVSSKPNLVLTKQVVDINGGNVEPGDVLNYSILIQNTGTSAATDLQIVDPISTHLEKLTINQGGKLTGNNIVWDKTSTPSMASLAPNASIQLTFLATIRTPLSNGTVISNQAKISSSNHSDLLSNDPKTAAANDPTNVTVVGSSKPLFTKSVVDLNGGKLVPGDTVVYTLTLSVQGTSPLENVVIADKIDVSLQSPRAGQGGQINANTVTWNTTTTPALAKINPGQSVQLTLTAIVGTNVISLTKITNQANLSATGLLSKVSDDPNTAVADDPTVIVVTAEADLSSSTKVVVDVNGGDAHPGDTLSYTITVRNTGSVDAKSVVVTDVVDSNLEQIVVGQAGKISGNTITWDSSTTSSLGSIVAGSSVTLSFTARIKNPLSDGIEIKNQAQISGQGIAVVLTDDPSTPATDDATIIKIVSGPSFVETSKEVTDLNGGALNPGDSVEYKIVIKNTGTDEAKNVVVTDTIDTNILESIAPNQGGLFSNGILTWNSSVVPALARMAVGASVTLTFRANVKKTVANGTILSNQAFVAADNQKNKTPSDDFRTIELDDATKITVIAGSDLGTSLKTYQDNNGGQPFPGDIITYTLTIANTGTGIARDVVVTDVIDTSKLLDITPNQGGVFSNGTITWSNIPSLASILQNGTVTLSFTARIAPNLLKGTEIKNQAFAKASDMQNAVPTDDPSTASLDDPTVLVVGGKPTLLLSKKVSNVAGGTSYFPGNTVRYEIEMSNTGNAEATNIVISDKIDSNLTNIQVQNGGVFQANNREILWNLPILAAGAKQTFVFTASIVSIVANQTVISNQAFGVSSEVISPVSSDDPTTTVVGDSTSLVVTSTTSLVVTKTVKNQSGSSIFKPGEVVQYQITIRNTGNASLQDMEITDAISPNLTDIQPGTGVWSNNQIVWKIQGSFAPNAQTTLTFTARIDSRVSDGTEIENQARVKANSGNGQISILSDDPNTAATNDPTKFRVTLVTLRFTKTANDLNGGKVEPGDIIEYTLSIQNNGKQTVSTLKVTDLVDTSKLENIRVQSSGQWNSQTSTLFWDSLLNNQLLQIAPQQTVQLTFSAQIKKTVTDGTIISNQATLSESTGTTLSSDDPNTTAVGDATKIVIELASNISRPTKTVKDLNGGVLRPGDTLEYTITVENTGGRAATGVKISDPIPSKLSNVSIQNGGVLNGNLILWTIGTLAPQEKKTVTFTGVVVQNVKDKEIISNQAVIETNDAQATFLTDDPSTPAVRDATQMEVKLEPSLVSSTKTAVDLNGGTLQAGDIIQYTIRAINSGFISAKNVRLVDATPLNTEYVVDSLRINGKVITGRQNPLENGVLLTSPRANTPNGEILPDDGVAPSDEVVEIVFWVKIKAGTPNGTRIRNQGIFTADDLNPTPTDNPTTANVVGDPTDLIVGGGPDLSGVQKTVRISLDKGDQGIANTGDELEYTISVRNTGLGEARNLVFTDTIPTNTEYIANSIQVNGKPQTDISSDDQAQFSNNTVTATHAKLEPNEQWNLTFKVRILRGDQVSNQGQLLADNFALEPTDSDGNDSNGNQPTVIAIGDKALLSSNKTVVDINGGLIKGGDLLEYRIFVRNDGTKALTNVRLVDPIDKNTIYENGSAKGANASFDTTRQVLTFQNITLQPKEEVLLLFQVRIRQNAVIGDLIENQASIQSNELPEQKTNRVSIRVEEPFQKSKITGILFQDIGDKTGKYDSKEDLLLQGFWIRLYQGQEKKIFKELQTAQDGQYKFEELDAGTYTLRIFSENEVFFQEFTFSLSTSQVFTRNIVIKPTGRVYQSENGTLISGTRIYLVNDLLKSNSCVRDEECGVNELCVFVTHDDNGKCGTKALENDFDQGQQGQKTNQYGMYYFSPKQKGKSYRIVILPPDPTFVYPSLRIKPNQLIGKLQDLGSAQEVVSHDVPDIKDPKKSTRYYSRFEVSDSLGILQNNHLPLDSWKSALVLTKVASHQVVTIGDIVTYTVTLKNNSSKDLKRDSATGLGGIYFADILPKGFRLLRNSARMKRSDGKEIVATPLDSNKNGVAVPSQRLFRVGSFDLPAKMTLTLRYQLVVGANLPVGQYVNIATAQNEAGADLTEPARALVRVSLDPIFDQGTVIGKVFCDKNKNRYQDAGEEGLPKVRIFLDTGHYVDSDFDGKFHFQGIDPGNHLLKLDEQSLPPQFKMIDTPEQIFYVSRGLLRKINFAVECKWDSKGVQKIQLSEAAQKRLKKQKKKLSLLIEGSVYGPKLFIDKQPKALPLVSVAITKNGKNPDFTDGSGTDISYKRSVFFHLKGTPDLRSAFWRLDVYQKGAGSKMELLRRTLEGVGEPPAVLRWDGKDSNGRYLLKKHKLYLAQFQVTTEEEIVSMSVPRLFGVSYTQTTQKTLVTQKFPAKWMGSKASISGRLARRLKKFLSLAQMMLMTPGAFVDIRVYHHNRLKKQKALFVTNRRAFALQKYFITRLNLSENRIHAQGLGLESPIVSNSSRRGRQKNERIEIRIIQKLQYKKALPKLTFVPYVLLNRMSLSVEHRGLFEHRLNWQPKKRWTLTLQTPFGAVLKVPLLFSKPKNISELSSPKNRKERRKWNQWLAYKKQKLAKTANKKLPIFPDLNPSVMFDKKSILLELSQTSQKLSQSVFRDAPVFRLKLAETVVKSSLPSVWEKRQAKLQKVSKANLDKKPKKTLSGSKKAKKKEVWVTADKITQAMKVHAAELLIHLPAKGAVIRTPSFVLKGKTHPENKLTINGVKVLLDKEGAFQHETQLKHGQKNLAVQTQDKEGNQGNIQWPIYVNLNRLFLLALGELTLGQQGTPLEGLDSIAKYEGNGVLFHGRAVFYAKGQLQGKHILSKLFKKIKFTAFLETPREREAENFFQRLIDPDKYYPIYGDSSQLVQDVQTRGWRFKAGDVSYRMPVYVMIEADRSKLLLGNFKTSLRGIELSQYDRTFHGFQLDFRKKFHKKFDTQVKVFVSDGDSQQQRAHIQLSGTGGSLYYLKHRSLLEGSEQVKLTIRDRDSGIVLKQIPLQRDQDYSIQYLDGRLFFKFPIPMVVDSFVMTQYNLATTLNGHSVFVEVDYEHEALEDSGDVAVGIQVKQTLWEKATVGFTFVREGKGNSNLPAYMLYGADLTFAWDKGTKLEAEFSHTESFDTRAYASKDGGLSFQLQQRINDNNSLEATSGNAYLVRAQSDIGQYFKSWKDKFELSVGSYFTYRERGFMSTAQSQEQGSIKGGALFRVKLLKKHKIQLKYDGFNQTQFDILTSRLFQYEKHMFNLHYSFEINSDWDVSIEYAYASVFDERDQLNLAGNFVTLGANWKLNKRIDFLLRQQVAFASEIRQLHPDWANVGDIQGPLDMFATSVGFNFKVFKDTYFSTVGLVRWSGNHSVQAGIKTKLDDDSSVYIREQLTYNQQSTGLVNAIVLGAEKNATKNTKIYGEYQVNSAMTGVDSRAVVGLSHTLKIVEGVLLGGALERAQFLNALNGTDSRTVARVSFQLLRFKNLKFSSQAEIRFDDVDSKYQTNGSDRIQFVNFNNVVWKATEDLSLMARVNYALTYNMGLNDAKGGIEGELLQATAGLAFRPVKWDWFNMLAKYTIRIEQRPLDLMGGDVQRSTTEVASVTPIFELPFRLQILEQLAYKYRKEDVAGLQSAYTAAILWISRLNFHLIKKFDIGVEYRMLWTWQASASQFLFEQPSTLQHGFLIEASYNIHRYFYVGAGYNFTSFTDNLFLDANRDYGGFFIRAIGKY